MASLNIPNVIEESSPIESVEHRQNYQAIETWANTEAIGRDGQVAMQPGTQLALGGAPTEPSSAVNKAYFDSELAMAVPVGVVWDYAGDAAPSSLFLLGQGQLVDKVAYPLLFALFGSKFGVQTTTQFRMPDLRSKFIVGVGTAAWSNLVGEAGGSADAVAIAHQHGAGTLKFGPRVLLETGSGNAAKINRDIFPGATVGNTYGPYNAVDEVLGGSTALAGDAGTDKNLPPYIVMNKIIRAG